jgi:hypothetical protein
MGRTCETRENDLVRLMTDDGNTVIWFPHPVDYEVAQLSEDLVAALKAWQLFFFDHEVANGYVVDAEAMPYYRDEGIRLARWLANEIGSKFSVEFVPDERYPAPRRFCSARPALNPVASRAFSLLAAEN